jgi:hypothetical protein
MINVSRFNIQETFEVAFDLFQRGLRRSGPPAE